MCSSIDVATREEHEVVIDLAALRPSSGRRRTSHRSARCGCRHRRNAIAFSVREPPTGRRVLYAAALETDVAATADRWSLVGGLSRVVARRAASGGRNQGRQLDAGWCARRGDRRASPAHRCAWSDVGTKLVARWSQVAAAVLREGQWSLRALDVRGGPERAITPPGPPRVFVRYPDWSARGDLIVFERAEMTGNIWLLDRREHASDQ